MAVAVVQDFAGGTLEQYDQMIAARGFSAGGTGPEGLLFHWATKTGDGVRTVEVWEDRDAHERHAGGAGGSDPLPGEPKTAFIDVHNVLWAA